VLLLGLESAIVIELVLVAQELLPCNVAGVSILQNDGPIITLDLARAAFDAGSFTGQGLSTGLGSAIDIGASVGRGVEDGQYPTVAQGSPDQFTVAGPPPPTGGEKELMVAKVLDDRQGRTRFLEQIEDEPQGLLNLFVGIKDDPTSGVVDQPRRRTETELAFVSLLQFAAQEAAA